MATQAFLWGIISAISLPIGALLGLLWRPGSRISSAFMAFGAGALLFALSIELLGHVPHFVEEHGLNALAVAVAGALAGGAIFDVLNQLLNNRGAFLRNLSNAKNHVARTKKARAKRLLRRLYRVDALRGLPPENMAELVKVVRKERYHDGEIIFHTGDRAQELHFIRRGQVEIVVRRNGTEECVTSLSKNDTFGELAVLDGNRQRYFDARAVGNVELYTLEKDDLERALAELPQLQQAVSALAKTRYAQWLGDEHQDEKVGEAEDQLDNLNMPVTEHDIHQESIAASGAAGAAMAIWLGIAIDGIPESLVIGTLAIGPEGMSLAFIVGVFLANLPEAMSSAVSMRKNGMSRRRILTMWGSLCLLTGVGAWLGAVMFPPEPQGYVFFIKLAIEALAAGAMLTMIAETMLPEAFEEGGSIIGFATLCGFLAALAVASV
jgi:CRP-like cAMP-binding protein